MTLADDLVAGGERLARLGLSPGSSGNISVRDGERILMSPTGADLGALRADQLSVLTLDGVLREGPKPSKEFPFHRAMYVRDPAIGAVVHVHSTSATAIACLPPWHEDSAVPPLTPYFVMRVGQTPLIPYAPPGDTSQAELIETDPRPYRAALLQNHGPVLAHTDLDAAIDAAIELEETCKLLLQIGARDPRLLTDVDARHLADRYHSPWVLTVPVGAGGR